MESKAQFAESITEGRLLLFDKPYQWTSFDVVNKLRLLFRKQLGIKKVKIGHAGTLDPLATGLLIVCSGGYTKRITEFQEMEKSYSGTFLIGQTTPSFDLETPTDQEWPTGHIGPQDIAKAAEELTGSYPQEPPQYSARKVGGERAYSFARRGEHTPLQPKTVHISRFEITRVDMPEADFLVCCSKGTYIRSLARDFGRALGSGATLKSLRRESIGPYQVGDAWTIPAFESWLKTLS